MLYKNQKNRKEKTNKQTPHSEVPTSTVQREGSGSVLTDLKDDSKQQIPSSLNKSQIKTPHQANSPTASVENGLGTKSQT